MQNNWLSTFERRDSGLELARIIATIEVIFLHYNNPVYAGFGLKYAVGLNRYALMVVEAFSVNAVNVFLLLSGYFMYRSYKARTSKVFELYVQVTLFAIVLYLGKCILGGSSVSVKHIIFSFLPSNYYIVLYSVVFMLSPFINKMLASLSDKGLMVLMAVLSILFLVYTTCIDVIGNRFGMTLVGASPVSAYGSDEGYTIVNFIVVYIIGAGLHRLKNKIDQVSTVKVVLLYFTAVLGIFMWGLIDSDSGWEYCNPLIVLSAAAFIVFFSRIHIKSKWINLIASGSLSVYLLHADFLKFVGIEKAVDGGGY